MNGVRYKAHYSNTANGLSVLLIYVPRVQRKNVQRKMFVVDIKKDVITKYNRKVHITPPSFSIYLGCSILLHRRCNDSKKVIYKREIEIIKRTPTYN